MRLIRLLSAIALLSAFALLGFAPPARADSQDPWSGGCAVCSERDPQTGACRVCKVSYHLSLEMPVAACNLATGACSAGSAASVALGACYGFTILPAAWYASGLDLCPLLTLANKDAPNREGLAVMAHVTPALAVGAGPVRTSSGAAEWWFFFAPRLPAQ